MSNLSQSHTPFSELPTQSRVLFFIYASAAIARFGAHPPTPTQLAPQLEAIWNEHQLCDGDLSDPDRLTVLQEASCSSDCRKYLRPVRPLRILGICPKFVTSAARPTWTYLFLLWSTAALPLHTLCRCPQGSLRVQAFQRSNDWRKPGLYDRASPDPADERNTGSRRLAKNSSKSVGRA